MLRHAEGDTIGGLVTLDNAIAIGLAPATGAIPASSSPSHRGARYSACSAGWPVRGSPVRCAAASPPTTRRDAR